MNRYIKSIGAGIVATAIVAGLLFLKHSMGFMPDWTLPYDTTVMIAGQSVQLWMIQVVLGAIIWPLIFSWAVCFFNGAHWIRGIAYALLVWYAMPIIFAPLFGKEVLAGKTAMEMLSLMHLGILVYAVYGFLLGVVYSFCCKCCNK